MADHDDFAAQRCGLGDLLVIRRLFRRPLALFPGLVLVHEVMQEVMRVVGSDDMLRSVIRRDVDKKNLPAYALASANLRLLTHKRRPA
jgi:hypothetical protein